MVGVQTKFNYAWVRVRQGQPVLEAEKRKEESHRKRKPLLT